MKMQRNTNGDFRIRTYGRTELAQVYNPELTSGGAWKRLRSWITYYPGLKQRLDELGGGQRRRTYTPAQVAAIIEALGEP